MAPMNAADEKDHQRDHQKTDGGNPPTKTSRFASGSTQGENRRGQGQQETGDPPGKRCAAIGGDAVPPLIGQALGGQIHDQTVLRITQALLHADGFRPMTSETRKSTMKMKNNTFAMPTAVPAMPPNPSAAAMSAMIRKQRDQLNMAVRG